MSATLNVVDLVQFANQLPKKHKDLAHKIRHLRDVQSIHTGLRIAQDFASSISAIRHSALSAERNELTENIMLALLNSAIVFYVRATKSGSRHRRTFDLRSGFSADQRADHATLCDLRDDAIAHFGPGGR